MAGTPMRHAPLSNQQILQALSESYNVVAAITKYQVFFTSGIGLPKDDAGRIELMAASMTVLEKIRTEIRALEHELDRQKDPEKTTFLTLTGVWQRRVAKNQFIALNRHANRVSESLLLRGRAEIGVDLLLCRALDPKRTFWVLICFRSLSRLLPTNNSLFVSERRMFVIKKGRPQSPPEKSTPDRRL